MLGDLRLNGRINFLPVRRMLIGLLALGVAGAIIVCGEGRPFFLSPPIATAQAVRFQEAAQQVYQRLPSFPLENQYISKRTKKAATENTLARRLILYHTYVKGRSPIYRFDWKITLADYLGLNDYLAESAYPGADQLRTNPMKSDRAVLKRLSRSQRNALVQSLVDIYTGNRTSILSPESPSTPPASSSPGSQSQPPLVPLPKPGDAQLLMPRK